MGLEDVVKSALFAVPFLSNQGILFSKLLHQEYSQLSNFLRRVTSVCRLLVARKLSEIKHTKYNSFIMHLQDTVFLNVGDYNSFAFSCW